MVQNVEKVPLGTWLRILAYEKSGEFESSKVSLFTKQLYKNNFSKIHKVNVQYNTAALPPNVTSDYDGEYYFYINPWHK